MVHKLRNAVWDLQVRVAEKNALLREKDAEIIRLQASLQEKDAEIIRLRTLLDKEKKEKKEEKKICWFPRSVVISFVIFVIACWCYCNPRVKDFHELM
ncbi:hypothetical protein ABZP36_009226 [Zizania latifolia]